MTGAGPFPPPSPVAQGSGQSPAHRQGGSGAHEAAAVVKNVGSSDLSPVVVVGDQSSLLLQTEVGRLNKANQELTEVSCYNSHVPPGLDSSLRSSDDYHLSPIIQRQPITESLTLLHYLI